jgi:hypothetical protein
MPRRPFRRALAASVFLHAALAGLLLVALDRDPAPARPGVSTDVEVRVTMHFADEPALEISAAPTAKTEEHEEPDGLRPPLARTMPAALPPEVLAAIRRPAGPVGGEVVEVPVTPAAAHAPAAPAVAPSTATPPVAHAPGSPAARPIHGALPAAKTIVYVLDASGSMGEWGKLAKAKAALVATLRRQPPEVRFQVVVYSGTARPLLNGGCAAATPENVALAAEKLRGVEPAGRSDHAEGLRAALALRPDLVLILTDADDLSAGKLKGLLGRAAKPATVCVARVTADGVGEPREVK